MGKVKNTKVINDPRRNNRNSLIRDAQTIEETLESFGIRSRVTEFNFNPNYTEFYLEIALGTPLEDVVKLHKDIAMALASMTGDVEIEAPIPGKSLIGIRLPYEKQWFETRIKGYDAWKKKEDSKIEPETKKESTPTWRDFIAGFFYLIATGFIKLAELFKKDVNL